MKYLKKFEGMNDGQLSFDEKLKVAILPLVEEELNRVKDEKGFLSINDYYKFMESYFNNDTLIETILHELVGEEFPIEDEPEDEYDKDDDDDIILPPYNLN